MRELNHAVSGIPQTCEGSGHESSGLGHGQMILSEILLIPSIPAKADISCWYCSLVELTPHNRHLYLYRLCVTNVVIWRDLELSSSSWYHHFRSSLLKTFKEPFVLCGNLSTVGMGY